MRRTLASCTTSAILGGWTHSSHPVGRKIALFLMHVYTGIEAIMAWFTLPFLRALRRCRSELKAPCVSYLGDTTGGCWSNPTTTR